MHEHGIYSVELKDNIIWVTLEGAFNDLGVLGWTNAIKDIVNTLNGKPFCILMDMKKALGGTPEAFAVSNDYNAWLSQQNMLAKALIYPSQVFEEMDNSLVPAKKNQNISVFDNIDDAALWLQQQSKQAK